MLRNLIPRAKASLAQRFLPGGWANRLGLKINLPCDPALLVNSFYKTAFGRPADPDGLANRIQQLQSGVPLVALAEELVASAEFQARHGQSQRVDTEYLTILYRDGLGRQPDPEGLAAWLAEGEKGATRAKVLAAIAGSAEALEKASSSAKLPEIDNPSLLVNSLYKTAFGRLADPKALADCIQQLRSGVSPEALADQLVASAEFQMRHGPGQRVDIKYLTALCRDGLGSEPNLESLASWLPEGRKGATRAKALAAVARSAEALERDFLSARDGDIAYSRWVAVNDTLGNADRAAICAHIAGFSFRPLISVVMLSGRISEVLLRESFNSLVTQLYPYWELCLGVDPAAESLLT